MNTTRSTHRRILPAALVLAAVLLVPGIAQAQQFAWFNGQLLGIWKTTMSVGAAVRGGNADPQLVGAGAGHSNPVTGEGPEFPGAHGGVGVNDDPELNFKKGDLVSAPVSFLSEFTVRHRSGQGFFLRVRAWYDMALESTDVAHGSVVSAYETNSRLSDAGFLGAAKFKGIDIMRTVRSLGPARSMLIRQRRPSRCSARRRLSIMRDQSPGPSWAQLMRMQVMPLRNSSCTSS